MADKFMCVYSEMQALKDRFDTEASDLNETATAMQTFQDNTVSTAINEFKTKISAFQEQITQTETDLKTETERVCGDGYAGGEGWLGEQSRNFVGSVNNDLAGCFNTLRQDMDEINTAFETLETKIAEVVTALKKNVESVSGFCTENSDFTSSMEKAAMMIDG
ncbi:MAG: hypothetical protein NC548_54910 [Lachnospiraceae bacterium]|nr:hypothetical protein [Lachnospiraceae bacterium]MCM1230907.1 hypothetical protein [Ruminococcus flavefaciens]